jgi:hypothetical protein
MTSHGPEDEEPEDEESKIEIGSKRFVEVTKFKGNVYVNIREFYKDEGKLMPSRKGIALKVEEWRNFVELQGKIEDRIRDKR